MRGGDDRDRRAARGERGPRLAGGARAAARARARRRAVRRRRALALLVLAAAVAVPMAAFGGSAPSRPPTPPIGATGSANTRPAGSTGATGASATSTRTTTTHTTATHTTIARAATPSPGSLPQTHAYPSGTSAQFRLLMGALWDGVVHDSVSRALPAFFPEQAYVQLKAIGDAGADWRDRLVRDFGLDLTAAHDLLGGGAAGAHLLAVNVVSSYGHWIPPGVCYNSIGYYEMPNARVVYREDGQVRSFGIASMISWRGVWYVVHFGAILRPTIAGQVDDPTTGAGVSAYSGTC